MSTELLEAAAELARLAGNVALRHFRRGVEVELKANRTPVTIADREAEQAAREWIERRFPSDGVLGEEFGELRPGANRRWIIDPIDGTKTFIRGVPLWGTLVALAEKSESESESESRSGSESESESESEWGSPAVHPERSPSTLLRAGSAESKGQRVAETILVGAAFFPAVDELVVAAIGHGTFHNGTRCSVSQVSELSKAASLTTDPRFDCAPARRAAFTRLEQQVALSRSWGDCYGYLLVATGRAEVMVDPEMSPWDAAALQPIIDEAGGVFTDWRGQRTAFGGSAIATNGALSEQVRNILTGSER